jgi:hypothetical protein
MTLMGWALVAVLLTIAALHLYWGFGGRWPGYDNDSLREMVVGVKHGRMYGLAPSAMVALALTCAASLVVARHSELMSGQFAWVIVAGYATLVLVFGLRGLAPYVTPIFDYARGTPFFDLNRLYYAPLCLLIAAGLIAQFPRWR